MFQFQANLPMSGAAEPMKSWSYLAQLRDYCMAPWMPAAEPVKALESSSIGIQGARQKAVTIDYAHTIILCHSYRIFI